MTAGSPAVAPLGALLRRSPYGGGPRFQQRALSAAISQLLAGDRSVPGRSPDAARVRAVRQHARGRRTNQGPELPGAGCRTEDLFSGPASGLLRHQDAS